MAYPDVLALLVTYLDAQNTAQVASRVPDPRPSQLIQPRLVGGTELRPVRDNPRFDIFCWDNDGDAAAHALGLIVRAQVHALAKTSTLGILCYRVDEVMGPRLFDDPETSTSRSWATYSLIVRAEDAIA